MFRCNFYQANWHKTFEFFLKPLKPILTNPSVRDFLKDTRSSLFKAATKKTSPSSQRNTSMLDYSAHLCPTSTFSANSGPKLHEQWTLFGVWQNRPTWMFSSGDWVVWTETHYVFEESQNFGLFSVSCTPADIYVPASCFKEPKPVCLQVSPLNYKSLHFRSDLFLNSCFTVCIFKVLSLSVWRVAVI